ncbi:MAG TPA: hypothetical protein VFU98_00585, partial [Microlunatus sp.]|nr:hypothetical protein [Microlunatus sp.]
RWGQDVIHCPYCHGWEVRDQPIGILATGPMAVHQALLFRQLSDDVLVFSHTSVLADDDRARLAVRQVRVVEGEVAELQVAAGRLAAVALTDGRLVPRQVLAVQSRMVARAAFLADLGLWPVDHPMGVGSYVPADPTGLSEVPGVYLAGNVTDLTAQVGAAAAAGALAGARINADLVDEETETALRTRQKTSVAITDASAGLLEAH